MLELAAAGQSLPPSGTDALPFSTYTVQGPIQEQSSPTGGSSQSVNTRTPHPHPCQACSEAFFQAILGSVRLATLARELIEQ